MPLDIIFILGLHRSGTTFANLVIGSHPDCIAVGEVYNVIRPDRDLVSRSALYQRCTCGKCSFWPEVMARIDAERATTLSERYLVFATVFAEVFPGKIPVDSSKRLDVISSISPVLNIRPVMVYRDVRGWCYSKVGKVTAKAMLGWYRGNRRFEREFPNAVTASYELLVLDGQTSIASLYRQLELRDVDTEVKGQYPEAHILVGNPMRGRIGEGLRYDMRWMAKQGIWPSILLPVMRKNRKMVYENRLRWREKNR